jgi:hypothetical protein
VVRLLHLSAWLSHPARWRRTAARSSGAAPALRPTSDIGLPISFTRPLRRPGVGPFIPPGQWRLVAQCCSRTRALTRHAGRDTRGMDAGLDPRRGHEPAVRHKRDRPASARPDAHQCPARRAFGDCGVSPRGVPPASETRSPDQRPEAALLHPFGNAGNVEKLRALPSGPGVGFRPVRRTRRLLGSFEAGCARALGGLDARLG